MAAQLSHVYPLGSRVTEAGHLELGGCDAIELAREFGTPAYVVVEDDVRERARAFVAAYAARCEDFEVHFASKAFPCTAVLRILREEGLACDVASGGELAPRAEGRLRPRAHPPARQREVLAELAPGGARPASGHVVVDNHTDIDLLEQHVPSGAVQRVQLRVAPGISPDTHPSISTGGPNTKFGFGLQSAPAAIERLDASDRLELEGLHLHIGSQIYDVGSFRTALEAMAGLALARHGQPRRRARRRLRERRASADDRGVRGGQGLRGARRHGLRRADPRRAGTRTGRQLDRHPVHGADR